MTSFNNYLVPTTRGRDDHARVDAEGDETGRVRTLPMKNVAWLKTRDAAAHFAKRHGDWCRARTRRPVRTPCGSHAAASILNSD